MQLKPDTLLQGNKYRILLVRGHGGFGITYLAENTYFEKKVAIKEFFPKDFCGRDNTSHLTLGTQNNAETVTKLKDRFLKEAKNIAKLDHPGIVKIHDIFEENNTAYYVMDYIDGENLNEMVKRDGPLPEAKAVEYICKVGEALEYLHSRNMTHFDVKPANIVVRKSDNIPILIDFGLSKQYTASGDATSTLMQGVSNGYSPIELYTSGSLSNFSPQTDVYSLGASLYFLITGKTPPSASELCSGMETLDIASILNPSIQEAIAKAMATNRTHRPTSISQFTNSIKTSRQDIYKNDDTHKINNNTTSKNENTILVSSQPNQEISSQTYHPSETVHQDKKYNRSSGWIVAVIFVFAIIMICSVIAHTDKENHIQTQDNSTSTTASKRATFAYPNASSSIGLYSGQFITSSSGEKIPYGEGTLTYKPDDPHKRVRFTGQFIKGNISYGTLIYKGGERYVGHFLNNEPSTGRYLYNDGSSAKVQNGVLEAQ
ncbi:MAG: serine/threonine protein kinase [Bacteroides sp.]|nr:serine/threonine protein kinase [Bacteroides sp.]